MGKKHIMYSKIRNKKPFSVFQKYRNNNFKKKFQACYFYNKLNGYRKKKHTIIILIISVLEK